MFRKLLASICLVGLLTGSATAACGPHRILCLAGKSGPALWNPINEPSLLVWFNAQDTAKMTFNSGNIAAWIDEKGTATATQATAANQPGYSSTINGLTVPSYNGTSIFLSSGNFQQTQNWIACSVASFANMTGAHVVALADDSSGNRQAQYLRSNGTAFESIAFNTVPSAFIATTSTLAANTPVLLSSIMTGTSVTDAINATNGSATSVTGTPASKNYIINFGGLNASMNGLIADFALFSSATTSIKQKCEGFLAWKYGLQGSLPGGFPYKLRPPYVSDP